MGSETTALCVATMSSPPVVRSLLDAKADTQAATDTDGIGRREGWISVLSRSVVAVSLDKQHGQAAKKKHVFFFLGFHGKCASVPC